MLAFWPDVVRPLLEALRPESIVEIGSESGKMTLRLIDLAQQIHAKVHAVDPAPGFDPDVWKQKFPDHFVFHRAESLSAMKDIRRFDAVLIDGDHNWYTVYSELMLLEHRCNDLGQHWPLILLHDVAWPYGRRDLYYAPERIPDEYRQPYAKRGISPTEAELLPKGGFNAHLCNALREGGPKNGVLTAVEDYLSETAIGYEFAKIPAVFGLAILMPEQLATANPELARLVRAWGVPEVARFIDRLETARIAMLTGLSG